MSKEKYRLLLIILLFIDFVLIGLLSFVRLDKKIPRQICLHENRAESFDLSVPVSGSIDGGSIAVVDYDGEKRVNSGKVNLQKPFSLFGMEKGQYQISLKLLGFIPMRNLSVKVVDETCLYPGGEAIGVKIDTRGVLVLGTGEVTALDGSHCNPAKNIVQSGDYIQKINRKVVTSKEELVEELSDLKQKKVIVTIERNGEMQNVSLHAVETAKGTFKLGIWVRDDTQGIGTLTYITEEGEYGALGHGINDIDTGTRMEIRDGYICKAKIYSIVKGKKGKPGELNGYLCKGPEDIVGTISNNTELGIHGSFTADLPDDKKCFPIALKQEIKKDKAYILCQLKQNTQQFEIAVKDINLASEEKGMVIEVTDERLLRLTCGIVQGMSGSPIIQNGKIIGAVTHVFVDDPTKGYGIFIENMLEH